MTPIQRLRSSGKSNSEVIADLIQSAEPGAVFSYTDLASALEEGSPTRYTHSHVCNCVRKANRYLLRQYQRELRNVPNVGYRLVHANEHLELAVIRRSKADRQLDRGLMTLRNVRWDEMDENSRNAHVGQLILTEAVFQQVRALEKRQADHSAVIGNLVNRIDTLERAQS